MLHQNNDRFNGMPMRIAIISDIHGNLEAFKEVLRDIDHSKIDRIVSLRDRIGLIRPIKLTSRWGPFPSISYLDATSEKPSTTS